MASYFASVKSFGDVPIVDAGVDMTSFLEASDGLTQILDFLGSAVFGLINVDIKSVNTAIRSKYEAAPQGATTLEDFVRREFGASNKETITNLIALLRYLLLIGKALQDLKENQNAQTHVSFQRSYDKVLGPHDSFVVRGVVRVAIRSAPSRGDIFTKLAQGNSGESLDVEMTKWLNGLVQIVDHMSVFMKEGRYGQV